MVAQAAAIIDEAKGNIGTTQLGRAFFARQCREHLADMAIHHGAIGDTFIIDAEAFTLRQLRLIQEMGAEAGPFTLILDRDQHIGAILGGEGAIGADGRMRHADARWVLTRAFILQQRHRHPIRHAIKQRHGYALALAGNAAINQRFQHRRIGMHAAGNIAGRNPHTPRAFRAASHVSQPGFCLHQQIIGLHGGVFAILTIARNIHGNQPRMPCAQFSRTKAGTRHGARCEVLDEDIRLGDQVFE